MKRDSVAIKKKSSLTLNFLQGDVSSFHPHDLAMAVRKQALAKWMFEGLTRLNLEGTAELAGAKNIEMSPCNTRYLITLRANCYSDGTPVLAQDYEIAWKKALSPDSTCGKVHLFYCIKNAEEAKKGRCSTEAVGVKALDKQTLLVELNHPTPYFLDLLTFPIFFPFKEEKGRVLGNGPYMLEQWKREQSLSLKLNPFFWARDDISIKKVKILIIKDETTALHLYEQGKIDLVGDTLSPLPLDILPSLLKRNDCHSRVILRPYWVYLNNQHFPLSSPLIRRALSQVIDRNLITKHILTGSQQLYHPLPESISSHHLPQDAYKNPLAIFEEGLKELKLTRETFPPLTLTFPTQVTHRKIAEYLQESWQKAFGIKVLLKFREFSTFASEMRAGNYEIGGCLNSFDYKDPLAPLERLAFLSNDFSRWDNSYFKEVIDQAKRSKLEDRLQYIQEAEEILDAEMPIIPVANQCIFYLCNPDLKGLALNQSGILDLRWAYFE